VNLEGREDARCILSSFCFSQNCPDRKEYVSPPLLALPGRILGEVNTAGAGQEVTARAEEGEGTRCDKGWLLGSSATASK